MKTRNDFNRREASGDSEISAFIFCARRLNGLRLRLERILCLSILLAIPFSAHADRYEDAELIDAAGRGDTKSMREMLNLGASVDAQNKQGETALMKGAANGKLESIQI